MLEVSGKGASKYFENETGKHCVQRVPPSERGGRTHTSMISVAVLDVPKKIDIMLDEDDLEIQATKGSGPGGQHRNKVSSAIRMIHKPSGLKVFIDGRSQQQNRKTALKILSVKVQQWMREKEQSQYDSKRNGLLGNRGRGDKMRTYNFKEKRVVDHRLGTKTTKVDSVMDGHFELILR